MSGCLRLTHIALREEAGAKLHIVFEVKGSYRLKLRSEVQDRHRFRQVFHTPDAAELLGVVLRDGYSRPPPTPAAMVAMGDDARRRGCWVLLVRVEVVVRRHYCWQNSVGRAVGAGLSRLC